MNEKEGSMKLILLITVGHVVFPWISKLSLLEASLNLT